MENRINQINIAKINFTMPNSKDVLHDLVSKIQLNESNDEIESIAYALINHFTGLTRLEIFTGKIVTPSDILELDEFVTRINKEEPLQYILGETEFFGRKFKVNPSVLIPRPETEQIVRELITLTRIDSGPRTVLEIGTGSGCLAVTIVKEMPQLTVIATDVSEDALRCATFNAEKNNASVSFIHHDVLRDPPPLTKVDFIVSNPPYITPAEKKTMQNNVLLFEPHLALFTPEQSPLLFYDAIALTAQKILSASGKIIAEINENYGGELSLLFSRYGFKHFEIKKDINSKDRIIIASRN